MGPSHFSEGFLLGLFFAVSAMAQLGWASLALTSGGALLLRVGVLVNLGCVALWAVTRTLGLPFGLIPGPEAVGAWDVATVVWGWSWWPAAWWRCVVRRTPAPPVGGLDPSTSRVAGRLRPRSRRAVLHRGWVMSRRHPREEPRP